MSQDPRAFPPDVRVPLLTRSSHKDQQNWPKRSHHRLREPVVYSFSDQYEGRPGHIGLARCKIVEPDVKGHKSFFT